MTAGIDRYWFLTWTTYGQWLPGDPRGSVTRIRNSSQSIRFEHDVPGTPFDIDLPGLFTSAQQRMKGVPIFLTQEHAQVLLAQFHETAIYRDWLLVAVGIMANHIHLVVGVPGDPRPEDILGDFKSYGSRSLNKCWCKPESGTWWTESGSKRKLRDEASIEAAVEYIREQEYPLIIWINPLYEQWRGSASGGC